MEGRRVPGKPNAHQMDVLTLASFNRGAIITSYAQVEFLLADLVLRWRTQTRGEEGTLPYSLDSRIQAAREVIRQNDSFKDYRAEVDELIDGLKPYREIRDMMAHGMQILRTHKDEWHQLDYRMFRMAKGGFIEVGRMNTSVDQLAIAAKEIGEYAQRFVSLWRRIYMDQGLEPVA
jgi:hypothetical protein